MGMFSGAVLSLLGRSRRPKPRPFDPGKDPLKGRMVREIVETTLRYEGLVIRDEVVNDAVRMAEGLLWDHAIDVVDWLVRFEKARQGWRPRRLKPSKPS